MTIKVFDKFGDLICQDGVLGAWLSDGSLAVIGVDVPPISALKDAAGALGAELGIRAFNFKHGGGRRVILKRGGGRRVILEDGRILDRLCAYALCEVDHHEPIEAARAVMQHIYDRFGPGPVHFLSTPSYLCKYIEMPDVGVRRLGFENVRRLGFETEDPALPPKFTDDPRRRVIVGAYYTHEKQDAA